MTLIAITKICPSIIRPLIRLSQEHTTGKIRINMSTELSEKRVSLWKVLTIRALLLIEIWHSVKPQTVYTQP